MSKSRVTIKDMAMKLNLSTSTVSRALKDHHALKKETIRMVKNLAHKLNFIPNIAALNLLNKRTNRIAIVVPEITNYFFSMALTGIQNVISSTEYTLMVCLSNESYQEEVDIIENLWRIQIDGVLVSRSSKTNNFDHFRQLQSKGIPIVLFDRDCKGLEADKVLVDDYLGAFQAIEYLIKSGCKTIAHMAGVKNLSTKNNRLQGYLDALKKHGLPVIEKNIVHAKGFTYEDGIKPAKLLLNSKHPPDAIFAANDRLAISAMYIANKLNLRIPDDISIIGFDDEPHSIYLNPALSSVWQPGYGMGMLSARILLKHLSEKDVFVNDFRHEVFKPELITRSSSKKILTSSKNKG